MTEPINLEVSAREFAAIMTGLVLYEGAVDVGGLGLGYWTEEIATNGGEFEAMGPEEAEALRSRLNCG